jgi:hypothetical protein
MNERMKEILDEAEVIFDNPKARVPVALVSLEDFKLITELIVKECIDIVEGVSPGYKDYRNQIEDAFRRDCVESIKHKFGVEE